jgi:hypothetical protein
MHTTNEKGGRKEGAEEHERVSESERERGGEEEREMRKRRACRTQEFYRSNGTTRGFIFFLFSSHS